MQDIQRWLDLGSAHRLSARDTHGADHAQPNDATQAQGRSGHDHGAGAHSDGAAMIYLLRFTFPLGNERHKAEFHIGYTSRKSIEERLQEHRDCRGARITAAAVERTSPTVEPFTLVWSVKGDRCDERMLKRRKRHADLARTWEAR